MPHHHAHGLGRRFAADDRDRNYSIRRLLPLATTRTFRYWYAYHHHLDQGLTSQCVAYSLSHYLLDAPITSPVHFSQAALYQEAQRVDEWPGEDYDGTSVRAGAKVLQRWGFIDHYYWAWSADVVTKTVLEIGPVVVGTNWYRSMFDPADNGMLTVSGPIDGGHAYVINGVNTKSGFYRVKNSWGLSWGRNGHAYISIEDFARLLGEHGEALIATEVQR